MSLVPDAFPAWLPVRKEEAEGGVRLRKECEHGRWEEHSYMAKTPYADLPDSVRCPGGEFLPEGALVKAWWCLTHKIGDGDTFAHWQIVAACRLGVEEGPNQTTWEFSCQMVEAFVVLDALASQVGESE